MGDKRRRRDPLRPLRRGVGLGLALAAAWGVSLTADLSGAWSALQRWASDSQAVVALMAGELGQPPAETALAGLDGWGRLLVEQSALLSAGTEAVAQRRQAEEETAPAEPIPDLDAEDNDDQTQVELQPPAEPDDVVETTSVGQEGGHYLSQDGVYLYNRSAPRTTGTCTRRATPSAPPTAPTTWSGWERRWPRFSAPTGSRWSTTPTCTTTRRTTGPMTGPRRR